MCIYSMNLYDVCIQLIVYLIPELYRGGVSGVVGSVSLNR